MKKKYVFLFSAVLTAAAFGAVIPAAAAETKNDSIRIVYKQADQARLINRNVRLEVERTQPKPVKAKPAPEQIKLEQSLQTKINATQRLINSNKLDDAEKALNELRTETGFSKNQLAQLDTVEASLIICRKNYQGAVDYLTNKLAQKGIPAKFRYTLLGQLASAYGKLQEYDNQIDTLLEQLSGDIPDFQAYDLKRAIAGVMRTAGDHQDAIAHYQAIKEMPDLKEKQILQLEKDTFAAAADAGDFEQLKAIIARINALENDPAKAAQWQLSLASQYTRAKKTAEAADVRRGIVMQADYPMMNRVDAFIAHGKSMRNTRVPAGNRVILYELGNTLLKDADLNPWKGKPAFADAAAEARERQYEDLNWIPAAIVAAKFDASATAKLCHYLADMCLYDLKDQALAAKFAQIVTDLQDVPGGLKVASGKILLESLLDAGKFAEADKLADQLMTLQKMSKLDFVAACAMKARVLNVQGKCDAAAAVFTEPLKDPANRNAAMFRALAEVYVYHLRYEEAAKVYEEAGNIQDAISVLAKRFPDKAEALAEKYVTDLKQPEKYRAAAFNFFLDGKEKSRAMRKKYPDLPGKVYLNNLYYAARSAVCNGEYDVAVEMLGLYGKYTGNSKLNEPEFLQVTLFSYAGMRDTGKLIARLDELLKAPHAKAAVKQTMDFIRGTFALLPGKGTFNTYYQGFKFSPDMTPKKRAELLLFAARLMMNARQYDMAEEIHKTYKGLYVAEPKKKYQVNFSDTPIRGLEGFLTMKQQPEKQLMDRKFGGNMDFLVTDVSTGDRAAGIGSASSKNARPTEMQIACDEYGVHFLFSAYDETARAIQAGLGSAGSYEMYLAPGINQPYFCFLPNLNTGVNSIWDTTYSNIQWHRLDTGSKALDLKSEQEYTADGYRLYMFLRWEKFYDKLPEAGDLWEFENIHWSRFGGYSWNGIKTIHGRSTWGHLIFNIKPEQLTKIRRHIVFAARKAYNTEKSTSGRGHGVIDRWKNDTVLGDPAFFKLKVEPVTNKLDDALKEVKVDMDDATVNRLFREAVPGWFGIRFIISDLRRQYLEEKFSE